MSRPTSMSENAKTCAKYMRDKVKRYVLPIGSTGLLHMRLRIMKSFSIRGYGGSEVNDFAPKDDKIDMITF
ncbi:uncharacterized protein PHALS_10497 [Plasmopara halstedii]|uniref:Uncharacterized protein n=1 Tax=Plasmopara halstedii TaxID=4781 RepID=A0A0P1AGI5_PLAHL|nr:uncharacterized protein PHALS_10497 [Plasmopara halstedii]CEG40289.1 hypothetical protein PHALS_10497 [Plasmopara halstedii]|eukprot:XP_024576658.1 hypothetical protein PHALS_10497 [Plasmopara halstedii]